MFIAILVAIVVAAGLGYYFMKSTKTTETTEVSGDGGLGLAKSDVEAKMLAFLQASKNDMLNGSSTFQPLSEAFNLRLKEVHEEFGVTLLTPAELRDGFGNLADMDLENLTFTWIACAKNMDMSTCWQNSA